MVDEAPSVADAAVLLVAPAAGPGAIEQHARPQNGFAGVRVRLQVERPDPPLVG